MYVVCHYIVVFVSLTMHFFSACPIGQSTAEQHASHQHNYFSITGGLRSKIKFGTSLLLIGSMHSHNMTAPKCCANSISEGTNAVISVTWGLSQEKVHVVCKAKQNTSKQHKLVDVSIKFLKPPSPFVAFPEPLQKKQVSPSKHLRECLCENLIVQSKKAETSNRAPLLWNMVVQSKMEFSHRLSKTVLVSTEGLLTTGLEMIVGQSHTAGCWGNCSVISACLSLML
jgi:hypothetical protein